MFCLRNIEAWFGFQTHIQSHIFLLGLANVIPSPTMTSKYGSLDERETALTNYGEKRDDKSPNQAKSCSNLDQTREGVSVEEVLDNAGFGSRHVVCLLALSTVITALFAQMEASDTELADSEKLNIQ